jgi:excisionase family DNA binding protein
MNETRFPVVLPPLLVDELQAASMLGISQRTFWTYRDKGEIPTIKIGRSVRFLVEDLRKFAESKRVCRLSPSQPGE